MLFAKFTFLDLSDKKRNNAESKTFIYLQFSRVKKYRNNIINIKNTLFPTFFAIPISCAFGHVTFQRFPKTIFVGEKNEGKNSSFRVC